MFRESEKSLKETPRGSFFVYPYESEKVIKVYSVTFSCFCEHEKEQRLSSLLVSFLHKLETKLNYACEFPTYFPKVGIPMDGWYSAPNLKI
jgi:hypothetical protein